MSNKDENWEASLVAEFYLRKQERLVVDYMAVCADLLRDHQADLITSLAIVAPSGNMGFASFSFSEKATCPLQVLALFNDQGDELCDVSLLDTVRRFDGLKLDQVSEGVATVVDIMGAVVASPWLIERIESPSDELQFLWAPVPLSAK